MERSVGGSEYQMATKSPAFPAALAFDQAPGLMLDYFRPAPWPAMTVRYPVGLALIGSAVALTARILRRWI